MCLSAICLRERNPAVEIWSGFVDERKLLGAAFTPLPNRSLPCASCVSPGKFSYASPSSFVKWTRKADPLHIVIIAHTWGQALLQACDHVDPH